MRIRVDRSTTTTTSSLCCRFPKGERNREVAQSPILRANGEQIMHLGGKHEWNGGVEVRVRVCMWECELRAVVLATSSDTVAHGRCFSDRKEWRADGKREANNEPCKKSPSVIQKKEKRRWGMLSHSISCSSCTSWGAIFNFVYSIHIKERSKWIKTKFECRRSAEKLELTLRGISPSSAPEVQVKQKLVKYNYP